MILQAQGKLRLRAADHPHAPARCAALRPMRALPPA